jgi:hypothetical protein
MPLQPHRPPSFCPLSPEAYLLTEEKRKHYHHFVILTCARLQPQVLGRLKSVVISNEERGEIFCDLQLRPCTQQKISLSYNARAPPVLYRNDNFYKNSVFPTPVVANERKGEYFVMLNRVKHLFYG